MPAKSRSNRKNCKALNKLGEPCRASAWENGFCIAHQPDEIKGKVGHASASNYRGRRGTPPRRAPDVARQIVEANAMAILAPFMKALGLVPKRHKATGEIVFVPSPEMRARLYGVSKEGVVRMSNYDDLELMMKAAERLMDRVYGKPKQAVGLAGESEGEPVRIAVPSEQQRAREVAQILAMSGAVGRNGHSN